MPRFFGMAMGKRKRRQGTMWVAASDLPKSPGHPFYQRLNGVLEEAGFDGYVERICERFYAEHVGRPSLLPGRYFRLLLVGYFEGWTRSVASRGGLRTRWRSAAFWAGAGGAGSGPLDDVADAAADRR